jgi:CBS domain-containing protein
MKVQDIMTSDVQCCSMDTNLASVAKLMWDTDCGVIPVVNVERQVLGMLTDRDICMACVSKNRTPSEITARETVSAKSYRCKVSDDIHTVMDIMKREQVRRLPVVDEEGILRGVISMNDIILLAGETKGGKDPVISCDDVARTLKGISAHRTAVGSR